MEINESNEANQKNIPTKMYVDTAGIFHEVLSPFTVPNDWKEVDFSFKAFYDDKGKYSNIFFKETFPHSNGIISYEKLMNICL